MIDGTCSLLDDCCAFTCQAADYIEMFYNPKRKHARNGTLSPVEFERQQKMKQEGVQKTRGYSFIGIFVVVTVIQVITSQ